MKKHFYLLVILLLVSIQFVIAEDPEWMKPCNASAVKEEGIEDSHTCQDPNGSFSRTIDCVKLDPEGDTLQLKPCPDDEVTQ